MHTSNTSSDTVHAYWNVKMSLEEVITQTPSNRTSTRGDSLQIQLDTSLTFTALWLHLRVETLKCVLPLCNEADMNALKLTSATTLPAVHSLLCGSSLPTVCMSTQPHKVRLRYYTVPWCSAWALNTQIYCIFTDPATTLQYITYFIYEAKPYVLQYLSLKNINRFSYKPFYF